MSPEDIKAVLKERTKSVGITYNVLLLLMLVVNLGLLTLLNWERDKFNSAQDSEFIDCDRTFIGDIDKNGIAEFAVYMKNPYHKEDLVVGKHPAEKSDKLVLNWNRLLWHGTFDVKGNKSQSPIFYFQNSRILDNSTRRHYYVLNCPSLEPQLAQAGLTWTQSAIKSINSLPVVEKDALFSPQVYDRIACTDAIVHPPEGAHGTTDTIVYFRHPYNKDVSIDKYPMKQNDTMVIKSDYAIWYGSYNLVNHEKFEKTLISFYKTLPNGSTRRHYYHLTCPTLEKELEQLTTAWWKLYDSWFSKVTLSVVLYCIAFGCLIGLVCGDCLARKEISEKFEKV